MNKICIVSFLILTINGFIFISDSHATSFGRIVDIRGSGFLSYEGKTKEIVKGDLLEMGTSIVVEHLGQVSFTDNADHRFHIGNSSSAYVDSKTVELRSGDMWFQSLNKDDEYIIKTANGMIHYLGGEGIISYDSIKGKTQVMVINGIMKFSNLRSKELNLSIAEGHFSFIDNSYDEGAPRDPTPVGEKTYHQLVNLFRGITPMDKHSELVFKGPIKNEVAEKKPEIHHVEKDINSKLLEEYKQELFLKANSKKAVTNKSWASKVSNKALKKIDSKNKVAVNQVEVHVYGQAETPKVAEIKTEIKTDIKNDNLRAPASILETTPSTPEVTNKNESDKLINDLKKL